MKKKIYEKPDMQVVEIQQQYHLLAGSEVNDSLQDEVVDEAW